MTLGAVREGPLSTVYPQLLAQLVAPNPAIVNGGSQFGPEGRASTQVFTELATNFKLSDEVRDALIRTKLENLDEFRFSLTKNPRWNHGSTCWSWVRNSSSSSSSASSVGGCSPLLPTHGSRPFQRWCRQTWTQVGWHRASDKKMAFWRLYHLKFPAEVHPADATLSRVTREISKRMLCVYNIWKVRTLQFQLHTSTRKRKVGDNLYTEDKEDDDNTPQDWESYLDKLHTLLVAYAMAGTAKLTLAAGTTVPTFDTVGVDTALHLEIPLDIMMSYFYRAKRTSSLLPPSKRLGWVMNRDTEERSEWVTKFRESQLTLGQVVRDTMIARDAHWLPTSAALGAGGGSTLDKEKKAAPATTNPPASQFQLGSPSTGGKLPSQWRMDHTVPSFPACSM